MGVVQSAAAKPVGRGLSAKHISCCKIIKFCQTFAASGWYALNLCYSIAAKWIGRMAHRCKCVAQIHGPNLSRTAKTGAKR